MIPRNPHSLAEELHALLNPSANSELIPDELSSERLSQILAVITKINNEAKDSQELINSKDENGLTPLAVAILKKYTEVTKKLIESKAHVNLQNEEGNTLLMHACSEGHVETATALIEAKADLNVKSKQGKTALHIAIKEISKERIARDQIDPNTQSHIAIATKLIDAKADLNSVDENKNTPLILAAENSEDATEIGLRLIAEGVDINVQNAEGYSALIWAAERCRIKLIKKLLEKSAKIDLINKQNESALDARKFANVVMDKLSNLDLRTDEFRWQEPLIYFSIDAMLIKHGAIIRNFKKLYDSILAADPNHPDTLLCLKALLEQHKPLSSAEENPLLLTNEELKKANAYFKQLTALSDFYTKDILDANTDLSMRGDNDKTLLMHACRTHNLMAVTKLINGKADLNARDKIGGTALMYAVKKGGYQEAVKLIEAKADLNLQDRGGRTALIRAIEYENTEAAIRLIDAKADFNIKDCERILLIGDKDFHPADERTPLQLAVMSNQVEVIKKMVAAKVDINAQILSGETALMLAAYAGHAESVSILLDAQASLNIQNQKGMTALMLAAKEHHVNVITQLIEAKADLNIEDKMIRNAFALAIQEDRERERRRESEEHKWEACMKLIEAGVRIPKKYSYAFSAAIENGKDELAKKIIETGIDLDSAFDKVITRQNRWVAQLDNVITSNMSLAVFLIQHQAKVGEPGVFNGNFYDFIMSSADPNNYHDMMILLSTFCKFNAAESSDLYLEKLTALSNFYNTDQIEEKIDLNIKNNAGRTPLMFAAQNNNVTLITKMISAKVDLNLKDNEEKTALIYAIENNRKEAAIKLVEAKADLNLKMKFGDSLLHIACENNNKELVAKLIEFKVDLNAFNSFGYTPLMTLCRMDDSPSWDDNSDAKIKAKRDSYNNRTDIASQLIEAKADINISSPPKIINEAPIVFHEEKELRGTALHYALANGRIEIIAKLIAAGADVNQKDEEGRTPLFIVCVNKNIKCALKLIKAGANLNWQDKNGMTALMELFNSHDKRYGDDSDKNLIGLAEQLIASKVDLNLQDNNGKNALMWAANTRNSELITKVIEAKVDLNIQDRYGKTALMNIGHLYSSDPLKQLIDAKADLNIQDNEGMSMFMRACEERAISTIELLLESKADLELVNKQDETAFDILTRKLSQNYDEACFSTLSELLKYQAHLKNPKCLYDLIMKKMENNLVDKNIPIFLKELCRQQSNSLTADEMQQASYYLKKLTDLADFFDNKPLPLEAKIDLNFLGPNGLTPLMSCLNQIKNCYDNAAIQKNKMKIMKLISAKVDLNIQNNEGKTALMYARHVDLVAELINAKADLNIQNRDGDTAIILHLGEEDIAKKLIEAKASLEIKNKKGLNALLSMFPSHLSMAAEIINSTTDLNVQDNEGNTALMRAVDPWEELTVINKLLTAKAKLDIQNEKGETALMLASQRGHLLAVEKLIEAKANLNLRNQDNLSALMLLLSNDYQYYVNGNNMNTLEQQVTIAKKLIEAGADFTFTRCVEKKSTPETNESKTDHTIEGAMANLPQGIEEKSTPETTKTKIESALDLAIKSIYVEVTDIRLPVVHLLLSKGAEIHNPMDLYQFLKQRDQREPDVFSSLAILCRQQEELRYDRSMDQSGKLTEEEFKEMKNYVSQLSELNRLYHNEVGQAVEVIAEQAYVIPKGISAIIGSYTTSLKDRISFFAQPKDIEELLRGHVSSLTVPKNANFH